VARFRINNRVGIFPILALAPDSRRMAAVSREPNGEAVIYDLANTKESSEVAVKPNKEPPAPKEPIELKPRWTSSVAALPTSQICYEASNNLLVLGSNEGVAALDVRTGTPRKEFAALTASKTHELFPLGYGRFGTVAPKRNDIEIWDAKSATLSERLTVPSLPAGPNNASGLYVDLSRNQKYIAIGRTGVPSTDYPDLPFRVVEAGTRKVLMSLEWQGGSSHFTADSSRVLVAEWTGRARWFKLPSGEQDGGWDFVSPQAGRISTVHAISANGSMVAYSGPGITKTQGAFLGIIDGKTGQIIRLLLKDHHEESRVSLSDNGLRVAVLRSFQQGVDEPERVIDVIDVATGLVFNRARIDAGTTLPAFDLTPDGKALVVYDSAAHKAYFFDLINP
jgi:hypothetical protein